MRLIKGGLIALTLMASPLAICAALPVETAQIRHIYPHDPRAFTEGLFFLNGTLYESTGYEGQSVIRSEDLSTGRAIETRHLPPDLFGEGIVPWKGEILSVTWRNHVGFRWSQNGLKQRERFHYQGEGWGMTSDGHSIILSDGTAALQFRDPRHFRLRHTLQVSANGHPVRNLNELEYVDGEILANIWMTPEIARIDPRSGQVVGWIDLTPLVDLVHLSDPDSIPNGIAYDARSRRLFVTGKNWPALFEISLPASHAPAGRAKAPRRDTTQPLPATASRKQA